MEKENIYVTIDSDEKRLRAIEILENAGEEILERSTLLDPNGQYKGFLCVMEINGKTRWVSYGARPFNKEITLDQLEQLLLPNYQVKDVILSLNELKQQAEKLGYDLVEKPYEPKVGDFGYFWDIDDNGLCTETYGYFTEKDKSDGLLRANDYEWFQNFRKLTESEKQKIQSAW